MKALSIWQPWAHFILHDAKRVENRTWYTGYRGPLLLHASKRIDEDEMEWLLYEHPELADMPRGAIVGRCTLYGCVRRDAVPPEQREWANGPWCWLLAEVEAFTPVPYRGRQGLFDVLEDQWRGAIAEERRANEPVASPDGERT